MEITRKDFKHIFPSVKLSLETAEFVSIDTELTGLRTDEYANQMDTPKERYEKFYDESRLYIIIQFGLSVFKRMSGGGYQCQAYSFYVSPNVVTNLSSKNFMCNSFCISFLAQHGFDFNKALCEGIGYILTEEYIHAKAKLQERHDHEATTIVEMGKAVEEPLMPKHWSSLLKEAADEIKTFFEGSAEKCITLKKYSTAALLDNFRFVLPRIACKSPYDIFVEPVQIDDRRWSIRVHRTTEGFPEVAKLLQLRQSVEMDDLDCQHGFTKLIHAIAESKVPLVGHNMFLDLFHTLKEFVQPVTPSYSEFCSLATQTFPTFYDTKVIANSKHLKSYTSRCSVLDQLALRTSRSPFVRPNIKFPAGFPNLLTAKNSHDAGYDAFITGLCYITMMAYIAKTTNASVKVASRPFRCRVYMSYLFGDCLDLSDAERRAFDPRAVYRVTIATVAAAGAAAVDFDRRLVTERLGRLLGASGGAAAAAAEIACYWKGPLEAWMQLPGVESRKVIAEAAKYSDWTLQTYEQVLRETKANSGSVTAASCCLPGSENRTFDSSGPSEKLFDEPDF